MASENEESLFENSPSTLVDLSIGYIVKNINIITTRDPNNENLNLRDGISLPTEICEKFLEAYQERNQINDKFANLFNDTTRTRLGTLKLKNAEISDGGFQYFMAHKPCKVELQRCKYLSVAALDIINENSENLISLIFDYDSCVISNDERLYSDNGYIINAPNLKKLTIHCRGLIIMPLLLLKPLANLTHLDLSECTIPDKIEALTGVQNLSSLVLHNVHLSKYVIEWIMSLHTLQHLDISQAGENSGKCLNPDELISNIVSNLPELQSLDISGTNLAGTGETTISKTDEESSSIESPMRCGIPGLISRVNSPLQFLGLFETHHDACKRQNIPAKIVSGNTDIDQLLTAATAYMERPIVLTKVLNDIYHVIKNNSNSQIDKTLSVILKVMKQHLNDKFIQIYGSAILFNIVKLKETDNIGIKLKRSIITTLLNAMDEHSGEEIMIRNVCLTFCRFEIPNDFLFEYERVVQILLAELSDLNPEGFVQRFVICILNSLFNQVEGFQELVFNNQVALNFFY